MYKFVLDVLPYDTGHLISIELDNGILDFYLRFAGLISGLVGIYAPGFGTQPIFSI